MDEFKYANDLSEKNVVYICPKYKYKFEEQLEVILKFNKKMNEIIVCSRCIFDNCIPIDYNQNKKKDLMALLIEFAVIMIIGFVLN